MPTRDSARRTCRIVVTPVGRRSAKPCAASAIARAWRSDKRSGCERTFVTVAGVASRERTLWEEAMRVVVDFDLCESNALCMQAAPEVFEVRDDDFLYVLQENPPEELRSKVEEAVRRCPKQAITLED